MTSFPGNKSNWQQPFWSDKDMLALVISELDTLPELLSFEEISEFNKALAAVYAGKAMIFQAGDCAERICESGALHVRKKLTFLEQMSRELSTLMGLPVNMLNHAHNTTKSMATGYFPCGAVIPSTGPKRLQKPGVTIRNGCC